MRELTAAENEVRPNRTPTRPRMMIAHIPCIPARAIAKIDEMDGRRLAGVVPSIVVDFQDLVACFGC